MFENNFWGDSMQYDKLYQLYRDGEIDEEEFIEVVYGGFEYDLNEKWQKQRRKKVKKKQWEEESE